MTDDHLHHFNINGVKETRLNNQLHNETGPARIYPDGTEEYYLYGKKISKEVFLSGEFKKAKEFYKREDGVFVINNYSVKEIGDILSKRNVLPAEVIVSIDGKNFKFANERERLYFLLGIKFALSIKEE